MSPVASTPRRRLLARLAALGLNPRVFSAGVSDEALAAVVRELGRVLARKAGSSGPGLSTAFRQRVARNVERLPFGLARSVRRLWDIIGRRAAGRGLPQPGAGLAGMAAAILATASTVRSQGKALADLTGADKQLPPGARLGVASTAYLGVSAFRQPLQVLRAAHRALATVENRSGGAGSEPGSPQPAAVRLRHLLRQQARRPEKLEWLVALLYAGLDRTGADLASSLALAEEALHRNPVPSRGALRRRPGG